MLRKSVAVLMFAALLSGYSFSQTPSKTKAKPAPKSTKAAPKADNPKPPEPPGAKLPDAATVQSFYERMFGFRQNIAFKVAEVKWSDVPGLAEATTLINTPDGQQVSNLYITADGKHAISGDLIPFGADPFADNREILKQAFGPVRGSATPEVTIVEFADLECPACKAAQPIMDKLLQDVPSARLIFQSFPIEALHPWAREAASYLDCLARTDNQAAVTFMEAVFTHQSEINKENATEKLKGYVTMAKADPAKIAACATTPETQARIDKSLAMGRELKITGTPTLFINGRPVGNVGNVPYEVLKQLVEFEANQKK